VRNAAACHASGAPARRVDSTFFLLTRRASLSLDRHSLPNRTVRRSYNMSQIIINGFFPGLVRQVAADAGADGVIDIFNALGGAALNNDLVRGGERRVGGGVGWGVGGWREKLTRVVPTANAPLRR
jgi:hypothetical protein